MQSTKRSNKLAKLGFAAATNQKFLSIFGLSEVTGLSVRTIRSLTARGVIPVIKAGWRTHLYQPDRVAKALERFEVKAVTDRNGNGR